MSSVFFFDFLCLALWARIKARVHNVCQFQCCCGYGQVTKNFYMVNIFGRPHRPVAIEGIRRLCSGWVMEAIWMRRSNTRRAWRRDRSYLDAATWRCNGVLGTNTHSHSCMHPSSILWLYIWMVSLVKTAKAPWVFPVEGHLAKRVIRKDASWQHSSAPSNHITHFVLFIMSFNGFFSRILSKL